MCIRDSSYLPGCFYGISDLSSGELQAASRGVLDVSKNSFCLLYTSDAADERSSVDLGGRRIIKKKKN